MQDDVCILHALDGTHGEHVWLFARGNDGDEGGIFGEGGGEGFEGILDELACFEVTFLFPELEGRGEDDPFPEVSFEFIRDGGGDFFSEFCTQECEISEGVFEGVFEIIFDIAGDDG